MHSKTYDDILNARHLRQFEENDSTLFSFIDCREVIQALKYSMEAKANNHPMQLGCRIVCIGMFFLALKRLILHDERGSGSLFVLNISLLICLLFLFLVSLICHVIFFSL